MKTFKTQVYLDEYAEAYCKRAFGVRRVIWNWTLDQFLTSKRETGRLPNTYQLDGLYRKLIKEDTRNDCFEWLVKQQTSPSVMVQVLADIKRAFTLAHTQGKKLHKKIVPEFKKKIDRKQTFSYYRTTENHFRADSDHQFSICTTIRNKRCKFRTAESVGWMKNENVKLCRMTISCQAGKYWLSVSYEKPNRRVTKPSTNTKIGIDLGIVKSVVSYDGQTSQEVSFNTKRSMHLDRLSKKNDRKLTGMTYGSKRYEKELLLKERRSDRAKRIRNNAVEEYTTNLVRKYHEIVIDDFSFRGDLKVKNPDGTYRAMVYTFKKKLEWKANVYDTVVRYANHRAGVKTTRKCSCCGSTSVHIDVPNRLIYCRNCQLIMDRDINAAINCFNL